MKKLKSICLLFASSLLIGCSTPNLNNPNAVLNPYEIDEGVIPTSYTSSGVTFKENDISFFANYITHDYQKALGKLTTEHCFYLRENKGFLMNITEINNLKAIRINDGNIVTLGVYEGKSVDGEFVKVEPRNQTFYFSEGTSYFKIKAESMMPSHFKSIELFYDQVTNNTISPYIIKNIEALKNQEDAQSLISISNEKFTNSDYWQDIGYAKDIEEAKLDVKNKDQSGFEGRTDYQINYNEDVIYNENMQAYRLADMRYGDNGNSFQINMLNGNEGPVIFKDCAYTYVEDIAAYITAFGDVPLNMKYGRGASKTALREWGINARLNYAPFDNDNENAHFYETKLPTHRLYFDPEINENDYYYSYYESDYGATVANDEPYQMKSGNSIDPYNDGMFISRGTLRFVWTYCYTDKAHSSYEKEKIINSFDRNVFFTSTHYNDYQQYLNYYHGWSLRFGNTTLGNPWGVRVLNNHLHDAPTVVLTSLKNINK